MTSALIKHQDLVEQVRVWHECADDVRDAMAKLHRAEQRLEASFAGSGRYMSIVELLRRTSLGDSSRVIEQLRNKVWAALFEKMEVRRFLSVEKTHELDAQLDGKGPPLSEITLENVLATSHGLRMSIPKYKEQAVVEVYSFLRPRSSLKTNSEFRVGPKVIISNGCEPADKRWPSMPPRVNYHRIEELRALDRVFHLLDGKGYVSKTHNGELVDAINATTRQMPFGSTEFFAFKVFGNGSLHIKFRKPELVAELNRIAGSKMLGKAAA